MGGFQWGDIEWGGFEWGDFECGNFEWGGFEKGDFECGGIRRLDFRVWEFGWDVLGGVIFGGSILRFGSLAWVFLNGVVFE